MAVGQCPEINRHVRELGRSPDPTSKRLSDGMTDALGRLSETVKRIEPRHVGASELVLWDLRIAGAIRRIGNWGSIWLYSVISGWGALFHGQARAGGAQACDQAQACYGAQARVRCCRRQSEKYDRNAAARTDASSGTAEGDQRHSQCD